MTHGESLRQWLLGYEGFAVGDRIALDALGPTASAFGLGREPGGGAAEFITGGGDRTERYAFTVRRDSQTDGARAANQAWLEGLERWLRARNRAGDLPALSDGACFALRLTAAYDIPDATDMETVFRLRLELDWTES